MMIIWNEALQQHDIRIDGNIKGNVSRYFDEGQLPNQNVTAEQAETVIQNVINPLILDNGYHFYIHIFSFPNNQNETIPFVYILWLGGIGSEPTIYPGNTYWWEEIGK